MDRYNVYPDGLGEINVDLEPDGDYCLAEEVIGKIEQLQTELDKAKAENEKLKEYIALENKNKENWLPPHRARQIEQLKHDNQYLETKLSIIQKQSKCCRDSESKCDACLGCCG